MSEPDRNLLQACRQGEVRAWKRLVDKYERLVYSVALNQGVTVEDAADVTQITFTILIKSLDDLQDDSNLPAWLATVARRHSWRLLKRRRREPTGAEEDLVQDETLLAESATTGAIRRWERVEWLESGLRRLDERCRNLLLALYFDPSEPSYEEIAEQFNMAVGSVGPTRARCLERLRGYLEG